MIWEFCVEHRVPGYQCSFCGRANTEAEWLFVHLNGAAICDVCIDECTQRMTEARAMAARRAAAQRDHEERSA
jgi:hypothetical protein